MKGKEKARERQKEKEGRKELYGVGRRMRSGFTVQQLELTVRGLQPLQHCDQIVQTKRVHSSQRLRLLHSINCDNIRQNRLSVYREVEHKE